jgi:hypothetical protein
VVFALIKCNYDMKSISDYGKIGTKAQLRSDYNILEIFQALISNQNSDRTRLALLNASTRLLANASNLLTTEEFLYW